MVQPLGVRIQRIGFGFLALAKACWSLASWSANACSMLLCSAWRSRFCLSILIEKFDAGRLIATTNAPCLSVCVRCCIAFNLQPQVSGFPAGNYAKPFFSGLLRICFIFFTAFLIAPLVLKPLLSRVIFSPAAPMLQVSEPLFEWRPPRFGMLWLLRFAMIKKAEFLRWLENHWSRKG